MVAFVGLDASGAGEPAADGTMAQTSMLGVRATVRSNPPWAVKTVPPITKQLGDPQGPRLALPQGTTSVYGAGTGTSIEYRTFTMLRFRLVYELLSTFLVHPKDMDPNFGLPYRPE